jgi:acyl carrier protein phosphodiesterase
MPADCFADIDLVPLSIFVVRNDDPDLTLLHNIILFDYLAHAYLSFNDPEILVGNLISDFIKGRKKFDFSPRSKVALLCIEQLIHSPMITWLLRGQTVFCSVYRLYSGAFMDVVYDHFLAKDKSLFRR